MSRLTVDTKDGARCACLDGDTVVERLAEYERTGATPGRVAILISENDRLKQLAGEKIHELRHIAKQIEIGELLRVPTTGIGDLSDGYHTFNELYHHRAVLFSCVCHFFMPFAWKAKRHSDGTMFDGMFIVGMEFIPGEQITYHFHTEPYWNYFLVKELECAPQWDGHTPKMAADRLDRISTICLVASEDAPDDEAAVKLESH